MYLYTQKKQLYLTGKQKIKINTQKVKNPDETTVKCIGVFEMYKYQERLSLLRQIQTGINLFLIHSKGAL